MIRDSQGRFVKQLSTPPGSVTSSSAPSSRDETTPSSSTRPAKGTSSCARPASSYARG